MDRCVMSMIISLQKLQGWIVQVLQVLAGGLCLIILQDAAIRA
jgi:hypothetical protein